MVKVLSNYYNAGEFIEIDSEVLDLVGRTEDSGELIECGWYVALSDELFKFYRDGQELFISYKGMKCSITTSKVKVSYFNTPFIRWVKIFVEGEKVMSFRNELKETSFSPDKDEFDADSEDFFRYLKSVVGIEEWKKRVFR